MMVAFAPPARLGSHADDNGSGEVIDKSAIGEPAIDKPAIDRAAAVLHAGGLVALPTETVYGLAADADNEEAVRAIFAAKGRPAEHPVIVHVLDVRALAVWARAVPPSAHALAAAFWPGPLTLVLKRGARATDLLTGGQDTIGLRSPSHLWARAVLTAFAGDDPTRALAAPSANSFGRISATSAEHVRADLGEKPSGAIDLSGAAAARCNFARANRGGVGKPVVGRRRGVTACSRSLGAPLRAAHTDGAGCVRAGCRAHQRIARRKNRPARSGRRAARSQCRRGAAFGGAGLG